MPPHYFEVDWYLSTLAHVRSLGPQRLLATHYLPMANQAVPEFLEASQAFVTRLDGLVLTMFRASNQSLDMVALIASVRQQLGIPDADYQYGLVLRAHLRRLVRQGKLVVTAQAGIKRWELVTQ
jgi:hypothetical protein